MQVDWPTVLRQRPTAAEEGWRPTVPATMAHGGQVLSPVPLMTRSWVGQGEEAADALQQVRRVCAANKTMTRCWHTKPDKWPSSDQLTALHRHRASLHRGTSRGHELERRPRLGV